MLWLLSDTQCYSVFDMDYYGDRSLSSADLVTDLSGQSGVAPPATPPVCVGGPATPPPPHSAPRRQNRGGFYITLKI